MDDREKLLQEIDDPELSSYFYLDLSTERLLEKLDAIQLKPDQLSNDMPFNAAVKGYAGALDQDGHPWIIKPTTGPQDILYQRLCTLAFLIDHASGTLAAPTGISTINGEIFRISKVVRKSVQISSYSYLDQPYIGILRADLVNRWLFFDEDRNPNNYLVVHSRKNKPLVVAIDYDKADLASEVMKITGDPDKFGWFRLEKTRFLTLLRPAHFEGISIEVFDARLKAICGIPEAFLCSLVKKLLRGYADESYCQTVVGNIVKRRAYIDEYFRRMFKPASETVDSRHDDEYAAFGQSFKNQYRDKN